MQTSRFSANANTPAYAWDIPIKSVVDLDTATDLTRADLGTSTHPTLSRTDVAVDSPTSERLLVRGEGLAVRAIALVSAIAEARRAGERGPTLATLRRLSGSLGAACDALQDLVASASAVSLGAAATRYVECALWCITQLIRSLEESLAHTRESERHSRVVMAAEFASLYALGHLDALKERASDESTTPEVLGLFHDELMWLTSSLNDELESDQRG